MCEKGSNMGYVSDKYFPDYLWATKRQKYVENKGGQKHSDCLFCAVIRGEEGIIKKVVYLDKKVLILLNPFPYNVGHIEVVPVKHVREPGELSEADRNYLFKMLSKTIELVKKTYSPEGINVGINIGEVAGASQEHLHIHVVPRWVRNIGFMEALCHTRVMTEDVDSTLEKYKKNLSILKKK